MHCPRFCGQNSPPVFLISKSGFRQRQLRHPTFIFAGTTLRSADTSEEMGKAAPRRVQRTAVTSMENNCRSQPRPRIAGTLLDAHYPGTMIEVLIPNRLDFAVRNDAAFLFAKKIWSLPVTFSPLLGWLGTVRCQTSTVTRQRRDMSCLSASSSRVRFETRLGRGTPSNLIPSKQGPPRTMPQSLVHPSNNTLQLDPRSLSFRPHSSMSGLRKAVSRLPMASSVALASAVGFWHAASSTLWTRSDPPEAPRSLITLWAILLM
ncbi:MAG: hypothetical protein QOH88_3102 [Verrucomicrobiota bacterium]